MPVALYGKIRRLVFEEFQNLETGANWCPFLYASNREPVSLGRAYANCIRTLMRWIVI